MTSRVHVLVISFEAKRGESCIDLERLEQTRRWVQNLKAAKGFSKRSSRPGGDC